MAARHDLITRNHGRFLIDGLWVEPSTTRTLKVTSPVTEDIVFEVAEAMEADVDKAVSAARVAFDDGIWSGLTPTLRAGYVSRLAELLRERTEDLAYVWAAEDGVLTEMAKIAPEFAVSALDRSVALASEFQFEEPRESMFGAGYLVYEPVGVVAAIAPWNVPLITMLEKIGPALIAGCTVIMKPAPHTPADAYVIAECAIEAGFPPGVLNLITAERDVSDYLVRHAGIDKVSFTGSLAAGRRIASVCGDQLSRVTLELGGKSAAIILDDYDLADAADSLVSGICMITGQSCAALTRVIVSRSRHDELVQLLVDRMTAINVGEPDNPETQLGPLAMKRQLEQVERYIAQGVEEGATLACGGKRPDHMKRGYYIEPTVFADVDNDMVIAQEEIFGPVICVIPCDDEKAAVRIANASDFGLAGAIYTKNTAKAYKIARQIRTGTVAQNGPFVDFNIGFGGFKQSGIGREGGAAGLKSFLESKTVILSEKLKSP